MKFKIAIARPTTNGFVRSEVANFVSAAWKTRFTDKWCQKHILELVDIPIQRFPTDTARNVLVQTAQQHEIDILFMLDEDSGPPHDFFLSALQFLTSQPAPSVIGCPYMSGDGEVQVYRFVPGHSADPQQPHWKITKVVRADAFQRTGIEQVASIGTHTIAYDMRVFQELPKPYFRYSYSPDHCNLTETEEMYLHRNLLDRGVKVYVDWDRWSTHYKVQEIAPLHPIPPQDIPQFWMERAKEYYLHNDEGRKELETYETTERTTCRRGDNNRQHEHAG